MGGRGIRRTVGVAIALTMAAVALPARADFHDFRVQELDAQDNVGAAIELSRATFDDGSFSNALLARDDDFADALASGGAQGRHSMPLLLTPSQRLDERVVDELDRLGADEVFVLGGEAAVAPAVVDALEATGRTVMRVSGRSRIETGTEIARVFFSEWLPLPQAAILVRAFNEPGGDPTSAFADSLAAGAIAGRLDGGPILLTESGRLSTATRVYLEGEGAEEIKVVYVLGGRAAVSDAVVAEIQALGKQVERIAGADRFATGAEVARRHAEQVGDDEFYAVVLTDGQAPDSWAPGFASGVFSVVRVASIVLANGAELPQATRTFLDEVKDHPGLWLLLCAPYVHEDACAAAEGILTP